MSADLTARDVTTEVRVAAATADAARATPGVVRLQPGLWGLVQQLTRDLWERATGQLYPDVSGVRVSLVDGLVDIELAVVVDARFQAASVAVAVQQAVLRAVTEAAGAELAVHRVAVHISELTLDPRRDSYC